MVRLPWVQETMNANSGYFGIAYTGSGAVLVDQRVEAAQGELLPNNEKYQIMKIATICV